MVSVPLREDGEPVPFCENGEPVPFCEDGEPVPFCENGEPVEPPPRTPSPTVKRLPVKPIEAISLYGPTQIQIHNSKCPLPDAYYK